METLIYIDDKEKLEASKVANTFTRENVRNRAYINTLGAGLVMKYLKSENVDLSNIYNMHSIKKILEDTDISDIILPNIHIDVRVVFDENAIFIPKSHFVHNIVPDIYLVLELSKDSSHVKFLGFFEPKLINKNNANNKYYFIEKEKLSPVSELIQYIKSHDTKSEESLSSEEIEYMETVIMSMADNDISEKDKNTFIEKLSKSSALRNMFIEFENFEMLSSKAMLDSMIEKHEIPTDIEIKDEFETFDELGYISEPQEDLTISDLENISVTTPDAGLAGDAILEGLDIVENIDSNFEDNSQSEDSLISLDSIETLNENPSEFTEIDNIEPIENVTEELISVDEVEPLENVELPENLDNIEPIENVTEELISVDEVEPLENVELPENLDNIEPIEDVTEELISVDEVEPLENVELPENLDNIEPIEDVTEELISVDEVEPLENVELPENLDNIEPIEDVTEELISVDEVEPLENVELPENLDNIEPIEDVTEELTSIDNVELEELNENTDDTTIEKIELPEINDDLSENNYDDNSTVDLLTFDDIQNEEDIIQDDIDNSSNNTVSFEELTKLSDERNESLDIENNSYNESFGKNLLENLNAEENETLEKIEPQIETDNVESIIEPALTGTESTNLISQIDNVINTSAQANAEETADTTPPLNNEDLIADIIRNSNIEDDENKLNVLYNEEANVQDATLEEISEYEEHSVPGAALMKKKTSSKNLVAATLLFVVLAGLTAFTFMSKNKTTQTPNNEIENTTTPVYDNSTEDILTNNTPDITTPVVQNSENKKVEELKSTTTTTTAAKPSGAYMDVNKITWDIPDELSKNKKIQTFLTTAGKSIKLTLSTDLLLATEYAYTNNVKIGLTINQNGSIQEINILSSSGSNQIDKIVLQSVKDTLNTVKPPADVISTPNFKLNLIIYF